VQDPTTLYRFENDADPREARAGVLVAALGGFVDAGGTQRLLTAHLLRTPHCPGWSPLSTSTSCSTTAGGARR
jgi:hypothetical protein